MPQTGGFSSTEIFRRVASKSWAPGSTLSWSPAPAATSYLVGDYQALKITTSCTITITGGSGLEVEYAIIGGGGAGGNRGNIPLPITNTGGGGGAGGALVGKQVLATGSYPVQIGAGGSATTRTSGTPSFIGAQLIAYGGGPGAGSTSPTLLNANDTTQWGQPGGSGGGIGRQYPASAFGANSAPGQGYPGGNTSPPANSGAGGGGASREGFNGGSSPSIPGAPTATGGQGGGGILNEFTGIPTFVAGGGGGGSYSGNLPTNPGTYLPGGAGGEGGGGNAGNISWQLTGSVAAQSGAVNTGGGGGAAGWDSNPTTNTSAPGIPKWNDAGAGGSGVIFLRWKRV